MRYPDTHKEDTRRRLLRDGAAELKQHGFAATGVDRLMKAAGLSGAALYAYYPSKDALLAAIVDTELTRTLKRLTVPDATNREEALTRLLDSYLSLAHVQQPRRGCILPGLAAELGRAPTAVRQRLEAAQEAFADAWAPRLGSRAKALFLLSQCVGTVLLARMSKDSARQAEILAASREQLATFLH